MEGGNGVNAEPTAKLNVAPKVKLSTKYLHVCLYVYLESTVELISFN